MSIVCFVTGVILVLTWSSGRGPIPFDRVQWIADVDDDSSEPTRYRMAQSLVRENRLTGLTHAEVESMLGPPTDVYPVRVWNASTQAALGSPTLSDPGNCREDLPAWFLRVTGWDRIFLVVRAGDDGRVTGATIFAN